jgi:hypothetical protein
MVMSFPLYPYEMISQAVNLLLGLAIGVGFGFVLESGGLGDARKLVGQFLLKDMAVFKVMFTAIITAMLGLFFLSWGGLINLELLQISDSYLAPQLVGGLVLGAGFAIAGYCPGTTVVGMASGKIDALYCFGGLFVGSILFSLSFTWLESFYNSTHLSEDHLSAVLSIQTGTLIFLLILIAVAGFALSEKLESRYE